MEPLVKLHDIALQCARAGTLMPETGWQYRPNVKLIESIAST